MISLRNSPACANLGIAYPIFGAPMGGVAGAELAAAVSSAGGIGILGHANVAIDECERQVRLACSLTSKPLGIGLMFPSRGDAPPHVAGQPRPLPDFLKSFLDPAGAPPSRKAALYDLASAERKLDIAIEAGIRLLACGLGAPEHIVKRAKDAGMTVISLVGSCRAAIEVEQRGVDMIVAQGHEAGGHTGRTSTLVLVPQIVDAVKVPVIAAGGIVDGRGVAAVMMLGAAGALIGTRLIASPEARTAQTHKQKIVDMRDDETIVSRCYTGKPSRVINNAFIAAWKGHDNEILPMPDQGEMVAPVVIPAKDKGSIDVANWPTGQGAVLVKSIMPAADIVRTIAAEAAALLGDAPARAAPKARATT